MLDDVSLNKVATIEHCLARIRMEYADEPSHLYDNQTRQDAIVLNLQRACQASIDLAMHTVRLHAGGVPQSSRQAFQLVEAGLLDRVLGQRLHRLVGFRNIAIHGYQALNVASVESIIQKDLKDFTAFARHIMTINRRP